MELVPSADGGFQNDGQHSPRRSLGAASQRSFPMKTATAGPDLQRQQLVGHKRLFAEIELDRTFAIYAREREDMLPCPYQVKDGPGFLTILSNGALLADVPGYHTAECVYPIGYKGLRTFPSMRDPSKLGDFEFEIRYGGIFPQGGPLFCVRQFGYGEELRGITPDEVWSQVVQKLREAGYQWKKGVNGHALFGLSSSVVTSQLERLPGIEDCAFYKSAADRDATSASANSLVAASTGAAQGVGGNKAQQEHVRLIKLQETYLQKQEQLMQRLDFERKREEAKERQRLEKEKQKALIEMQREEQRLQLEKSREVNKIIRAETEAKRKLLQRAQGRLIMIEDLELKQLRRQEGGAGADKEDCDFLDAQLVQDLLQVPPGIRGSTELIPDLLEIWEFLSFFRGILQCPSSICGNTFWSFCHHLEHQRAQLFHWLHVVLVQELFRDLPASSTVFRGRPLNALTWPELLRHYIEMLVMEHEEDGLHRLSLHMKLDDLCEALQCEFYEELPFRSKVHVLLANFHLAIETSRFRQYVDIKLDLFEALQSEKRLELERLRRVLSEQQQQLKVDKQNVKNPHDMHDLPDASPTAPSATTAPVAMALDRQRTDNLMRQLDHEWRGDISAGAARGNGIVAPTAISAAVKAEPPGRNVPGAYHRGEFALTHANAYPSMYVHADKAIPQMDGASLSDDHDDAGGGMVVDDDEEEDSEPSQNHGDRMRDAASDEYESGDGSDMDAGDMEQQHGQGDDDQGDNDDEDDADDDGGAGRMSEDEDDGGNGAGAKDNAQPVRIAGAGKGVLTGPQGQNSCYASQISAPDNSKLVAEFKKAWHDFSHIPNYDDEVVRIKTANGEESFGVHELYWSVQAFGGSVKLEKWKMAANDMVMRRTGRPCEPVPGRGYGYIPKAWDRWQLSGFERRYGAGNIPQEYAKPAFVATRRAMLQAAGLPLSGRKKQGNDDPAVKQDKAKAPRRPSGAPRSRATGGAGASSRSRPRSCGQGSRGQRTSGGRAPLLADGLSTGKDAATSGLQLSSPEVAFLLKLLESKTLVRGLTQEEMVIKRAIELKHKKRMAQARFKTEPLGADRYRRQYWVLGNDYSVIWVQNQHSSAVDVSPTLGTSAPTGGASLCERMRTQFLVISSAEQVNKVLKALDPHGVRENELLENITFFRQELSEAMGAPIDAVLAEPGDKDPLSAAVANTLAIVALHAEQVPLYATEEQHAAANGTGTPKEIGHWEKTSSGNRVWVSEPYGTAQPNPASAPPVEQTANGGGERTAVLSNAAKFLETTQPVSNQAAASSDDPFCFSQRLYAKSAADEIRAAQEYFGILDHHHSAAAAAFDLPSGMCKIKGDLLLIEMAVNEEAVKQAFLEARAQWLCAVRDARTPAELLAVAREFIDNVNRLWLEDWYESVVRPWDKRPPPLGVQDESIAELDEQQEEDGDCAEGVGHEEAENADSGKAFEVGDVVEAKAQGYQRWWEATIVNLREDGAFEICWSVDPQVDTIKKPSEVRRKKVRSFKAKEPAEPLLPPWLLDTHAALVSLAEKEEAAAVTTAKVALVVYGFDEALRFDRFATSSLDVEKHPVASTADVGSGNVGSGHDVAPAGKAASTTTSTAQAVEPARPAS